MTMRDRFMLRVSSLLAQAYTSKQGGTTKACYGLSGHYSSWDEAARVSTGYAGEDILGKTKVALLKSKTLSIPPDRDATHRMPANRGQEYWTSSNKTESRS